MVSFSEPKASKESGWRRSWILLGVCVLGGSILAVAPVAAQSDEGASWTLSRLVRYALDNNKRLAAARLGTDVAKEDVAAAAHYVRCRPLNRPVLGRPDRAVPPMKKSRIRMSALGHKQTFFDCLANVRFRG